MVSYPICMYIYIRIPVYHQVPFFTSHIYSHKTTKFFLITAPKKCSDPPRCKLGDPVNHEALASAENPSTGIQSPKLRIVSWNQNSKDFGGDGIHQSFSDNMTRGLDLMKFHWNPDWLMTGSWSRHDVITIPIKLGSKITRVFVNNYADGWVNAAWTVPPFRNTDQGFGHCYMSAMYTKMCWSKRVGSTFARSLSQ